MRSERLERSVSILTAFFLLNLARAAGPGEESEAQGGNTEKPARTARPASELARRSSEELLELGKRTRALEVEAHQSRKAGEVQLQALAAEKQAVERAVEALRREAERLEKDLQARKEALGAREKELARLQHELAAASDPLKPFLDRVEKLVEGGIAWRQESRRAAIARAREALSAPGAAPASGLAALAEVQEEEEALGRTIEPGAVEVEAAGERRAAGAFRLGLLAVVFAGDEGSLAGFALPAQKLEEGMAAVAGKPEAAAAYRTALAILRRRRLPALVDLPVPALPRESAEEAR